MKTSSEPDREPCLCYLLAVTFENYFPLGASLALGAKCKLFRGFSIAEPKLPSSMLLICVKALACGA